MHETKFADCITIFVVSTPLAYTVDICTREHFRRLTLASEEFIRVPESKNGLARILVAECCIENDILSQRCGIFI